MHDITDNSDVGPEVGLLSHIGIPGFLHNEKRISGFVTTTRRQFWKRAVILSITMVALFSTFIMLYYAIRFMLAASLAAGAAAGSKKPSSKFSQYFDANPEIYPGPTATGRAPFAAQETMAPMGEKNNKTIQQLFGHLSPYSPNIIGFGVEEQPLPVGANITQVHVLHRHGSRYPTVDTNVEDFGTKIEKLKGKFNASGDLSFLNDWSYGMGQEIMVPQGRLQLFESGVNHYYQYGHLYNPNSKILVRTTTQERMRESAWNFLTGFFSFDWASKVDVGYGIEGDDGHWNNSLAGYDNCPNGYTPRNTAWQAAQKDWEKVYLQNATSRLNSMIEGLDFTLEDAYAMQTMCPYEIAAYAYSPFCDLFTLAEWQGFEYSLDIMFAGYASFASPMGRAIGLGWVQEFASRLKHQTFGYSGSQINTTLDNNPTTFPVNQSLYFDFSHDTNIMSIITALGFTQFAQPLPSSGPPGGLHNLTVSQVTPFGARLDIEVITAAHPIPSNNGNDYDTSGSKGETKYLRFKLNERTLPHPECGVGRSDGLCEVEVFLGMVDGLEEKAAFDHACFGEYEVVPYGQVTDGRPVN